MNRTDPVRIKDLIDRLARIASAEEWGEDINPTQWTALSYLARANRFSRSPSQVSDFMSATRGTVSQTLKALARKGLVTEVRSDQDKRSISYSITDEGKALVHKTCVIEMSASRLTGAEAASLLQGLEALAEAALRQRDSRAFGVCRTCAHHEELENGGYCRLLKEPLAPAETNQICHEHSGA